MKKGVVFVLFLFTAGCLWAQSPVADSAKKAKENGEKETPTMTLTSADLQPNLFGSSSAAAEPAEGEEGAQAGAEKGKDKEGDKADKSQDEINDEYQKKLSEKYQEISDLSRLAVAAKLDYNQKKNDYNKSSSGVYRDSVLRKRLDEAYQRITDSQAALDKANTEAKELENEARKNGVPASITRKAHGEVKSFDPKPDQTDRATGASTVSDKIQERDWTIGSGKSVPAPAQLPGPEVKPSIP